MATVSRSLPELSPVQRKGAKLTLVGGVMFAVFPVMLLGEIDHWRGGVGLWILSSTFGACVLVWGVFVSWTGERRSLTPTRALWIPALLIVVFVGVDLLTRARLLNWWVSEPSWSDLNFSSLAWSFPQLGYVGASTYVVLGAAVRIGRWRAALPAIGLILFVIWLLFQQTYPGTPVIGVTLVGIVPFFIGYRATRSPADAADE